MFSTPVRLSSSSGGTFFGESWVSAAVDVRNVRVDGMSVSGSISIGNADDLFAYSVLAEGAGGKAITIYGYDAGAVADNDFVRLVDCVGGEAEVDPDFIKIALRDSYEFTTTPRAYVNAASGFTYLIPAGKSIKVNGQTYTIER
jgi:hypothetical protein